LSNYEHYNGIMDILKPVTR